MSQENGVNSAASVYVDATVTADVDAAVAARAGLRLIGYSVNEDAGVPAAAHVEIVNGATGAAGTSLALIELAASTSETVSLGDAGIDASSGLSINWIAGSVAINLYYKII